MIGHAPSTHPLLAVLLLFGISGAPPCQQLAIRTFRAQDGLAHPRVNCVHQDQRGFVWFGTWEGLSRFDGSRFVNYGVRDGLPNPYVSCLAERSDGTLWVGTLGDGIACLRPAPDSRGCRFDCWQVAAGPRGNDVVWLAFDPRDRLWLATPLGLHSGAVESRNLELERILPFGSPQVAGARLSDGTLCCWGDGGMTAIRDDDRHPVPVPTGSVGGVVGIVSTPSGLITACGRALFVAASVQANEWRQLPIPLLAEERIASIVAMRDGRLWVGTTHALRCRTGETWSSLGIAQGLPDSWIRCLYADRDNNLWIGTHRGGLARLADLGAVGFGPREGFGDTNVSRVVEGSDGRIYATTDSSGVYEVFSDHVALVPGGDRPELANAHVRFSCDDDGDFWLGTDQGLWSCPGPGLDLTRARRVELAPGFGEAPVCGPVEQTPDGCLWFGTLDCTVHRLDSRSGSWQTIASLSSHGDPTSCRTALGDGDTVLLASFDRLWRWEHGDVRPVALAAAEPLRPRCLLRDSRGWVWIGTRFQGVYALRDEAAGGTLHLDGRNGLTSDAVWSLAEDRRGRIYFGTGQGICRFDPGSTGVRPFGGTAPLAGGVTNHLKCDRNGNLWAASSAGLIRFDLSRCDRAHEPPAVFLVAVEVDGRPMPMDQDGTPRLEGLVLRPEHRSLEVQYVGLRFCDDRPLRFQHMLTPMQSAWSSDTTATAVQFADLPAGEHRLLVRALDADGSTSATTAELQFTVEPPFWRRAWFVVAAGCGLLAAVWLWHRASLRSALATERLRTQIASDLHDEVGAGLAQIAILSEVARRRADPDLVPDLGEIASVARTMREAMGDIIWALARGNDTLADLVQRLRHLCSRMLEVDGTTVRFTTPTSAQLASMHLTLEQRRHVWLWCREALTNAARHADARAVEVMIETTAHLRIRITDDGVGFAPGDCEGNGLPNLRRRALLLHGTMHILGRPGHGTTLLLVIPLRPRSGSA